MTDKLTYLSLKHASFQSAVKSAFKIKILVGCDEESTIYFNKNLLTPAEFLNSLNIKLKPMKLNVDDGEVASMLPVPPMGVSFVDVEEFGAFDPTHIKLTLLKNILDHSPSAELLNKLETADMRSLEDFLGFMTANRDHINWYDEVQRTLMSYFHKSLKDLQFSIGCRPLVIVSVFTYDEQDFEAKVQKRSNYLVKQYKAVFGQDIWENIHLSLLTLVMFDISDARLSADEGDLERRLMPLANLVKRHSHVKIPINNPQKSQSQELFDTNFDFASHVYLKNRIAAYNINGAEKLNANAVRPEDRGKQINRYDAVIIRDNIEKSLNDGLPSALKLLATHLLTSITLVKKNKKKNFWSFFGGNRAERNVREQDLEQTLMVHSFNLAELYFSLENYELAAAEFKNMVNVYSKIDLRLFVVCLEYYIYSLTLSVPVQELYGKIDGITQKLMEYYLEDASGLDVLKCNRLSCLVNLVLKIGKHFEPKKVESLDRAYADFELSFNKHDYNKEYGFLKPLFKEEYSYRLLVARKHELRRFLYNIIVTADYYGQKLKANHNFLYTLYLYALAFSFYRASYGDWRYIVHFVTQTLAQYKESLGRYGYALEAYVDFVNTYHGGRVSKEGEESHLRIYLDKLATKLRNTGATNAEQGLAAARRLKLFELGRRFSYNRFDERVNSIDATGREPRVDDAFRYTEFLDVIARRFSEAGYVNYSSLVSDVCLLFGGEEGLAEHGNPDYVRETYVGEEMTVEFTVNNNFNVS